MNPAASTTRITRSKSLGLGRVEEDISEMFVEEDVIYIQPVVTPYLQEAPKVVDVVLQLVAEPKLRQEGMALAKVWEHVQSIFSQSFVVLQNYSTMA